MSFSTPELSCQRYKESENRKFGTVVFDQILSELWSLENGVLCRDFGYRNKLFR